MAKDSMIFYKSTADALSKLDDASYKLIMTSIFAYAYEGVEPQLDGVCDMAWLLIRPQIDACIRRYDAQVSNGKKGGRKPKQNPNETQTKPKQNPMETFNYNDNYNENVNDNDNDNDDDNAFNAPSSQYARGGEMNPDDDYELRHEDDGRTYFEPRVKLGWKKTSTGHEPLTQEQKDYWTKRALEFQRKRESG